MRGGWLHSRTMACDLLAVLHRFGAKVWMEYPVRSGSRSPAVDLYVEFAALRIALEIELGPRRIAADLAKAQELGVDELVIVTATPAQAAVIKRHLAKSKPSPISVQVLPFGASIRHLSQLSRFPSLLNEGTNTRPLLAADAKVGAAAAGTTSHVRKS